MQYLSNVYRLVTLKFQHYRAKGMEALFMIQNNSVKYEFQGVAEYGAYSPLFLKDAEKFE